MEVDSEHKRRELHLNRECGNYVLLCTVSTVKIIKSMLLLLRIYTE